MARYPSIGDWIEEIPQHKEIMVIYRSKLNFINHYVCFFISLIVVMFSMKFLNHLAIFSELSFRWFALFPLLILLETLRQLFNNIYVITKGSILSKEGIWSLNYRSSSIRYNDIRAVTVRQSFWGRLLDVGDLVIDTAAQDLGEVAILGVRNPSGCARMVEELRDYSEIRSISKK